MFSLNIPTTILKKDRKHLLEIRKINKTKSGTKQALNKHNKKGNCTCKENKR